MRARIIGYCIVLLLLLPVWMWLAWFFTPKKQLNALIVDKTVLQYPPQEHESFNWVLTNSQYTRTDGSHYNPSQDYLGFFPLENKEFNIRDLDQLSSGELEKMSDELDMAYFTDTYGIYDNDWYGGNQVEISKKIYGGLSPQDMELMRYMKEKKKLLISEFNCIASPTSEVIRKEFEALYDIRWTGWTGRYYEQLDTNKTDQLPSWVTRNYMRDHEGKWPFRGEGLVLVNNNEQVEILEYRSHLNGITPLIKSTPAAQKELHIPAEIRYPFWFEINQTSRINNVAAVFELNTNDQGDSILNAHNILRVFPAVIQKKDSGNHMYYFAGDFADNPIDTRLSHFKGIEYIKSLSINKRNYGERESFFYDLYLPMMRSIVNRYYEEKHTEKK